MKAGRMIERLCGEQNWRCCYCGRGLVLPPRGGPGSSWDGQQPADWATRDHVVPRVAGGTNDWTNLVAACAECNQRRSAKPALVFFEIVQLERRLGRRLKAEAIRYWRVYPRASKRPTLSDIWPQQVSGAAP